MVRLFRFSCRGVSVSFLSESVLPSTPNAYSKVKRKLIVSFFAGTNYEYSIRMPRIHIFSRRGGGDAMIWVVRSLSIHTAGCMQFESVIVPEPTPSNPAYVALLLAQLTRSLSAVAVTAACPPRSKTSPEPTPNNPAYMAPLTPRTRSSSDVAVKATYMPSASFVHAQQPCLHGTTPRDTHALYCRL